MERVGYSTTRIDLLSSASLTKSLHWANGAILSAKPTNVSTGVGCFQASAPLQNGKKATTELIFTDSRSANASAENDAPPPKDQPIKWMRVGSIELSFARSVTAARMSLA